MSKSVQYFRPHNRLTDKRSLLYVTVLCTVFRMDNEYVGCRWIVNRVLCLIKVVRRSNDAEKYKQRIFLIKFPRCSMNFTICAVTIRFSICKLRTEFELQFVSSVSMKYHSSSVSCLCLSTRNFHYAVDAVTPKGYIELP